MEQLSLRDRPRPFGYEAEALTGLEREKVLMRSRSWKRGSAI